MELSTCLQGKRVLIVEDECAIALDLQQTLVDCGAEIAGPASSVEAALVVISASDKLDCVVLDLDLQGASADPIVRALQERQIPFAITTAYSAATVQGEYGNAPILEKPVNLYRVAEALSAICH